MKNLNITNEMKKYTGSMATITIHPVPSSKQLEALLAVLNHEYKNNKNIEVITQYSTTTIRITL
jgi:peptide subunit release factor 1 (eRF1)